MNWECTHTHRPKVYIDWHCALQLVKKIFVRYVYYHFGKHWKSCRRYFGKDLERLQYQFDSIHLASIELLVAENVLALNFHSLRFCVCRKSGQKWRGRQSNYVAANKVGGQIAIVVVVANAQGLICRVQHNYRHSQQALLTRALLLSSMTSGCQRCKCTFAHCELWIVLASQWKPVRAHSGHDCTHRTDCLPAFMAFSASCSGGRQLRLSSPATGTFVFLSHRAEEKYIEDKPKLNNCCAQIR